MGSIYSTINNLEEIVTIAGNEWIFTFRANDESGQPVDLSSTQCGWYLCEYGDPNKSILYKSGVVSAEETNEFTVKLTSAETEKLNGRYIHQPVVVDFNGSTFRPAQGSIVFAPAIKKSDIDLLELY